MAKFQGTFPNLSALISGVASPKEGDTAHVDPVAPGTEAIHYHWDNNDLIWVQTSGLKMTVQEARSGTDTEQKRYRLQFYEKLLEGKLLTK